MTTLLKTVLSVALALAVTVLALVYAFWDVDTGALLAVLGKSELWIIPPYVVLLVGFYLFTGLRWSLILRPLGRYSLGRVTPAMMIGFGGNNILPAHLGELARTVVFARANRVPLGGVFTTLVVERIFDVLAILLFYLAAVYLVRPFPESIRLGSSIVAWAVGGVILGLFLFLRFPDPIIRLWDGVSRPLPQGLRNRGRGLLVNVREGLSSLKSVRLLIPMMIYSILKWLTAGGMVWIVLYSYGEEISLGVSMIVIAVTAVAVTVPSTPGFFGAIQAAFVFALTPFGISHEVALAASLYYHLIQWVLVTIAGAVFFYVAAPSLRELRSGVEEMQQRS